jgi:hypothetical protein
LFSALEARPEMLAYISLQLHQPTRCMNRFYGTFATFCGQCAAFQNDIELLAGMDGGLQDVDALPDNMTDVVSLATDMSAYTDRSVKNSSMYSSSGHTASTVGGQGAARTKKKGRSGKLRQGTPEEEQKLCLLVCDLAPSPELCTQVC